MRTTVDLDSDLLKRLRSEAHRRGLSVKELLHRVIRLGLDVPGRSEPYQCPTFSMGTPAGAIDLDKALSLAGALEDEETARELRMRK
jgi:hypothetical protein